MGKVIGPKGTESKGKCPPGRSEGPKGTTSVTNTTTQRGYESKRTEGLRKDYKENGRANNSKA